MCTKKLGLTFKNGMSNLIDSNKIFNFEMSFSSEHETLALWHSAQWHSTYRHSAQLVKKDPHNTWFEAQKSSSII